MVFKQIMKYKYIHFFPNEKFIEPYISFIEKNFDIDNHYFIYLEGKSEKIFPIKNRKNILTIKNLKEFLLKQQTIKSLINNSEKIFIHGLYKWYFIIYLSFFKHLLKKVYWIIWGSDLYIYNNRNKSIKNYIFEVFRKKIIKKIGNVITYIKGDYELAQKWYHTNGKYHECFMYPSNLYKDYSIKDKRHATINIQLGNSADLTNKHIEVLNTLLKYKDKDIKIYTPLSYGDQTYAKEVIKKGKELFGDKFIALTEFIPFEQYLEFLSEIDIAIFAHKRQQAMGNIITLLGLGKKIYMSNDITPWQLFNNIDVKIYDVENIELDLINDDVRQHNQNRIKEYFSKENYLKQLNKLFEN